MFRCKDRGQTSERAAEQEPKIGRLAAGILHFDHPLSYPESLRDEQDFRERRPAVVAQREGPRVGNDNEVAKELRSESDCEYSHCSSAG